MTLSPKDAKKLTDRALSQATLDDVRVQVRASTGGHARFANGMPTTSGDLEALTVEVTAVTPDGRKASVQGNRTSPDALAALVRDAEALAKLSPVDPETMPPMSERGVAPFSVVDRAATRLDAAARVAQVKAAVEVGVQQGVDVAGFLQHADVAEAYANRSGYFAFQRRTQVQMTATARTADGTGSSKAGFASHAAEGLDGAALVREAAQWSQRSRSPATLPPGRYTVILSANAVAELLTFFLGELSHRAAAEGRSYFSAPNGGTKLGQTLFDRRIRLWSDPRDAAHPGWPLADEGVPRERVVWVEGGKLEALQAGRYWASRAGVPVRPYPSTLRMDGEDKSLLDLVGQVERGVLVTRFWYNRMLEPRNILVTGLTRDGTFLVENGRITQPIKNFRYNDGPLSVLQRPVALGRPERAPLVDTGVFVVPPVVVEGFNFESGSEAV